MNKAICYIRVGPLETKKPPFRRADQEKKLRNYCNKYELDIMLVILDARVEAFIPFEDRLGGGDLSNTIDSKSIQHVVIWRLDRLFRSASEMSRYLKDWSSKGIVCHVLDVDSATIRTDQESGKIAMGTLTVLADMARALPAERTKTSIRLKKTHRFVYGATPFGYDLSGNQLILNSQEQEIIRQVKVWREAGWSLRKIADELNKLEVPTKRASSVSRDTRWYASTVSYLLKNELYLGDKEN